MILPPHNPSRNYPPISISQYLASINAARAALEGLGPLRFNVVAFAKLSVPKQVFVLSNLERTTRGLAPAMAMMPALDAVAAKAALHHTDPLGGITGIAAEVDGYVPIQNAFSADFGWMYDDGPPPSYHGQNLDCPRKGLPGCWGHRDAILNDYLANFSAPSSGTAPLEIVTGTGFAAHTPDGPWVAQMFEVAISIKGAAYTWSEAITQLQLPAYERGPMPASTTTTSTIPDTTTTTVVGQ